MLSGNRNFEGRINPDVKMNYLASPPLVVAYALAGTMDIDLATSRSASDADGKPVYLQRHLAVAAGDRRRSSTSAIAAEMFTRDYADVFAGDERWHVAADARRATPSTGTRDSTYVRKPPYFDGMPAEPAAGHRHRGRAGAGHARRLGDHRPHLAGRLDQGRLARPGKYLTEHGVERRDFNSYGSRRGNHEVMIRGTFANIRLRNQLAPGTEGGFTRDFTAGRAGDHDLRRVARTTPAAGIAAGRSWPARSTARARRATGRPRARRCSACGRSSPSPTSASTAPT